MMEMGLSEIKLKKDEVAEVNFEIGFTEDFELTKITREVKIKKKYPRKKNLCPRCKKNTKLTTSKKCRECHSKGKGGRLSKLQKSRKK